MSENLSIKTNQEQWEPIIIIAIGMVLLLLFILVGCYILELNRNHPEPMVQILFEYEGPWNASVTLSTGKNYFCNDTGRGIFNCYLDYGEKIHVCARKMDGSSNFLNVTMWSILGESKIVETGSTNEPHGIVQLEFKQ